LFFLSFFLSCFALAGEFSLGTKKI
jgi:hypothetical protein